MFLAGTEDFWGYDWMKRFADRMKASGCNSRLLTIGGGRHSDAWVSELDEVFRFFDQNRKE